jgi:hypothetical protein
MVAAHHRANTFGPDQERLLSFDLVGPALEAEVLCEHERRSLEVPR